MKVSWKRTLIWLAAALVTLFIPMTFIYGIYVAMIAICYLAASIITTVKKSVKPHIPYSIAAVIQAVIVTAICSADIEASDSNTIYAASAFMTFMFFVPFLLIMAAAVYFKGRKKEKEEQRYE